jgi:phosphoglycolate phosphatase-like HAD superfamily hydrolase
VRRLVLWDIDGTLVQAGDVGRDIFTEAFQAVLGRAPDQVAARMLAMAGRTDPEIALEFLAAHEIAEGERHLPAFSDALVTALAAKAAVIRERGRALPGARETLAALGRADGVVQSLLTGNVQPNALLKLASFELDGYLDLEVGGFGSDHRHRPSLVEVARTKAERKYGTAFAGTATVLVGDTPLDVAAGRAGGARVVRSPPAPTGSPSSRRPAPTPSLRTCATPRPPWRRSWPSPGAQTIRRWARAADTRRGSSRLVQTLAAFSRPGTRLGRPLSMASMPRRATVGLSIMVIRW